MTEFFFVTFFRPQPVNFVPAKPSPLLYVDFAEGTGKDLFRLACREDLEGIVAKWKFGLYDCNGVSSWIKVKNPNYTQIVGRENCLRGKRVVIYLIRPSFEFDGGDQIMPK